MAASSSHFVTAAAKFSCCSSNKKMSPSVFFLALNPFHPFSRWASLACRPPSLFLCISLALYSKFMDMTIYLSHVNNLDNTDTETISAFRFRLYWLFSCLTRVAMRFPAKITSSYISVAIPVDWVILHWYACGADGRSLGRAVGVRSRDYQIFSDGWITSFSYPWCSTGALALLCSTWRASRARAPLLESSVRSEFTANL